MYICVHLYIYVYTHTHTYGRHRHEPTVNVEGDGGQRGDADPVTVHLVDGFVGDLIVGERLFVCVWGYLVSGGVYGGG